MQFQLISDNYSIDHISSIQTNAIYETDFYVLVMDNFARVGSTPRSKRICERKLSFLSSLCQFKRLMLQYVSRAASFNPGAKFIILYNNPMDRHQERTHSAEFAFQVFKLMYNRYNAANVIFLYASDVEKYSVYVTNPYRNTEACGSLKPILLDECVAGVVGHATTTLSSVRLSKVPETLPNCTFKFCARIAEPYIYEDCQSGLEIQIIKVLQDILHFEVSALMSLSVVYIFGIQFQRLTPFVRTTIEANNMTMARGVICSACCGTMNAISSSADSFPISMCTMISARQMHIFKTPTRGKFLVNVMQEEVNAILSSRYVYVAPLQPPWLSLITIFHFTTWLVFIAIFVLAAITWYLLGLAMPERKQHKSIALCVLNSWSVFLGISANNRPDHTPLRIFFIILALYSLTAMTIYTSKLITVFTSPPYEEQIDTIEEIIESGLPIGKINSFVLRLTTAIESGFCSLSIES